MGVAVLSPENCLRDTFPHQNRRLLSPPRSNPRRSTRRKPQWTPPDRAQTGPGQTRILKRGQDSTGSLFGPGPNPLMNGFYAGSAFFTSPPPSSVPLPAFCTKSNAAGDGALTRSSAEDAAFDLRRILRLEQ